MNRYECEAARVHVHNLACVSCRSHVTTNGCSNVVNEFTLQSTLTAPSTWDQLEGVHVCVCAYVHTRAWLCVGVCTYQEMEELIRPEVLIKV